MLHWFHTVWSQQCWRDSQRHNTHGHVTRGAGSVHGGRVGRGAMKYFPFYFQGDGPQATLLGPQWYWGIHTSQEKQASVATLWGTALPLSPCLLFCMRHQHENWESEKILEKNKCLKEDLILLNWQALYNTNEILFFNWTIVDTQYYDGFMYTI